MNNPAITRSDFENLFLHYARGLMVYAREYVGSHEEAEDVVHDVFVSFWQQMDRLSDDNIKAYLFRATRNRCFDHLDRLKIRADYKEKIIKEKRGLKLDVDFFVEPELEKRIGDAIGKLPPQRRKVLVMHKFEGKTFAGIASELGISPRTVDKHVEMAVKSLRKELSEYLPLLLWLLTVS